MRLERTVVTILLSAGLACEAQEVMSLQAYKNIGQVTDLDTLYISCVHVDTTLAVFGGVRMEEFMGHYQQFYRGLSSYLHEHGFDWEDTTRCFNKLYFHADGRMDKYLYSFNGTLAAERQQRFQELATSYLKDYRFPMSNTVPFRQCGGSRFVPVRSDRPEDKIVKDP